MILYSLCDTIITVRIITLYAYFNLERQYLACLIFIDGRIQHKIGRYTLRNFMYLIFENAFHTNCLGQMLIQTCEH